MSSARPLVTASLASLVLAAALAVAGLVPVGDWDWWAAHGTVALYGFLVPALLAFTVHALGALLGRPIDQRRAVVLAILWFGDSVILAQSLLHDFVGRSFVAGIAVVALVGVAGMTIGTLLKALPKRKESIVDVARDPLTKGDDACAKQLRFAQFFLAPGVLLAAAPQVPAVADFLGSHATGVHLAGIHLLAAHVLVSCYGLAHLWVPRLSGVPAIAAGAIKGELHSTLLAVVLLVFGFIFGVRGLLIAGGAFAFLGAFTFMGVIGANIMRNKSKTQRITPEFTYIPWAFTAVFWLMSGVLLGIFLNVIPQVYASQAAALRFTHVHIALLGGAAQLVLALAYRIVPQARGVPPPPFHEARWGYWGINLGLALLIAGRFGSWPRSNLFMIGSVLILLGLAASFISLVRHGRVAGTTG